MPRAKPLAGVLDRSGKEFKTMMSDISHCPPKSALRLVLRDVNGGAHLTSALLENLERALQNAASSPLVVMEGRAGSFCEGFDSKSWGEREGDGDVPGAQRAEECLSRYASLLRAIGQLPQPTMALVDGAAVGAGVGLAAICDVVLATPRATFSLPETAIGLIPAQVFPILARRVGVSRARLMAIGDQPLCAAEALRLGLIDEISSDLEATLLGYASRFARSDPRAVQAMKALVSMHFCAAPEYDSDADLRCAVLLASRETRARLSHPAKSAPTKQEETC